MKVKLDFRNPRLRAGIVIVLVGALGSYLWYDYGIQELKARKAQLESDLAKRQRDLKAIQLVRPQLANLRQEVEMKRVELDSLREMFPDQKEIPKLIQDITRVAAASTIYTREFVPQPDKQLEHYVENSYDLSIAGGYHNVGHFFSYLAGLPLIINLSDVKIQTNKHIRNSIEEHEQYGTPLRSVVASFKMTTFSSKR
jgi:type IV pilus assembly protein PilO